MKDDQTDGRKAAIMEGSNHRRKHGRQEGRKEGLKESRNQGSKEARKKASKGDLPPRVVGRRSGFYIHCCFRLTRVSMRPIQ